MGGDTSVAFVARRIWHVTLEFTSPHRRRGYSLPLRILIAVDLESPSRPQAVLRTPGGAGVR